MNSSARLLGVLSRRGLVSRKKVGRTSTVTWTKQTVSIALIRQPRKGGTVALW